MAIPSNLAIWERVRHVPDEAKKAFNNGKFSGTDINPVWRLKMLTEVFGAAGIGWYTDQVTFREQTIGDEVMVFCDLNLYVKDGGEWSKPIFGTGGNAICKATRNGASSTDEGYKMAYTDAISVACKALGIGADVYFDKDKTKYTASHADQQPAEATAGDPQIEYATPEQVAYINAHATAAQIKSCRSMYGARLEKLTAEVAGKLIRKLDGGVVNG